MKNDVLNKKNKLTTRAAMHFRQIKVLLWHHCYTVKPLLSLNSESSGTWEGETSVNSNKKPHSQQTFSYLNPATSTVTPLLKKITPDTTVSGTWNSLWKHFPKGLFTYLFHPIVWQSCFSLLSFSLLHSSDHYFWNTAHQEPVFLPHLHSSPYVLPAALRNSSNTPNPVLSHHKIAI